MNKFSKILKSSIIVNALLKTFNILNSKQKKFSMFVVFTTFINGLFEVLGIALIIPIIYLLNDKSPLYENHYLNKLFVFFNVDENLFLLLLILLIVFIFIIKNIIGFYFVYIQNKFSLSVALHLTKSEFHKYIKRDYLYFSNTNSNNIIHEIIKIPEEFSRNILTPLSIIITELFVFLFILIGISFYNIQVLILLSVSIVPMVLLFNILTQKKIQKLGIEKNKITPRAYKNAFDAIFGYVDLKLFRKENHFINKSINKIEKVFSVIVKQKLYETAPHRIIEFSALTSISILYCYVVFIANEPEKIIELMVVFAVSSYRLLPSLNRIYTKLNDVKGGMYVFETLNSNRIIDTNLQRNEIDITFNNEIALTDIKFKYPNQKKPALDEINLKIFKGDTIGIVGTSGSGKSTLGKIVLRLLIEQEGSFKVDNKIINNNSKWNNLIGYVKQDFYLIDGTLAENIAFGTEIEEIDTHKMKDVLKKSRLEELVNELEDGILTNIGEFGSKLSGGQRQRIAIARVLFKGASVLIFDEATSSLDNVTEKEIMDTIFSLSEFNLTSIIIAHRHTSLYGCNRIIKMENGQIKSELTYNELIS